MSTVQIIAPNSITRHSSIYLFSDLTHVKDKMSYRDPSARLEPGTLEPEDNCSAADEAEDIDEVIAEVTEQQEDDLEAEGSRSIGINFTAYD